MSGPPDPQSSPRSAAGSAPGEPEGSPAARLLEEIRERMERLEGNLSLRERRVARVERALREAEARLTAERARFAAEREAIEKGLPQQLRERERQLEAATRSQQELEKRLAAHLAREREMLARLARLTAERDQAAGYAEKAHHELAQMRQYQADLENQLQELNRRRDDWRGPASTAPPAGPETPAPAPMPLGGLGRHWRGLSPVWRKVIPAIPLLCLLAGAITYWQYPRTYRIESTLSAPSDWATALAGFKNRPAESAGDELNQLVVRTRESTPALMASMLVRDRADGLARMNSAMEELLRRIPTATTRPTSQPARREQLQEELEKLDARIAALTAGLSESPTASAGEPGGAPAPADPAELLAGWQKTLAERKAVDQSIHELDAKLRQKPPELSDVQLTPEQIRAAIAADARLQADSEVLQQRESKLADILRQLLDAARPAFTDMAQTAAAADQYLEELMATPQDADVAEALQVIRTSLTNCARAAASLAKTWQDERAAIDAGAVGGGMAARYSNVDTAARQYVESTANSLALLEESLDAISQGGEEPTKRLVLRNALARKLQPALDAREVLVAAVRQVSGGENVELATLAQGVGGLHAQVVDRRARLEQSLRNQALAELRAEYDREIQALRARREELIRKAAEMDAAVVRGADEALARLGGSQAREAALTEIVALTRRRPEIVANLAALDAEEARAVAARARLEELRCSGAVATEVTPGRKRAWTALGAGLAPIALAGLAAGLLWAVRASRSSDTLDHYAKALADSPTRDPAAKKQQNSKKRP